MGRFGTVRTEARGVPVQRVNDVRNRVSNLTPEIGVCFGIVSRVAGVERCAAAGRRSRGVQGSRAHALARSNKHRRARRGPRAGYLSTARRRRIDGMPRCW
jgi:hypothetical protein